MNITIVTTAQNDMEARALLQAIGIPFRKKETGKSGQSQEVA